MCRRERVIRLCMLLGLISSFKRREAVEAALKWRRRLVRVTPVIYINPSWRFSPVQTTVSKPTKNIYDTF